MYPAFSSGVFIYRDIHSSDGAGLVCEAAKSLEPGQSSRRRMWGLARAALADLTLTLNYLVSLHQNTPPGHVVVHVAATDRDGLDTGKVRYYIMDGDPEEEFTLDEHSGIVSVKTIPDREKTLSYSLKVGSCLLSVSYSLVLYSIVWWSSIP